MSEACAPCVDARCVSGKHRCRGRCLGCGLAPTGAPAKERRLAMKPASGQEIVEYKSAQDFERDKAQRLQHGWRVASISDSPQRAGLARFATLGLGALVIKPKSHIFVVWEKGK